MDVPSKDKNPFPGYNKKSYTIELFLLQNMNQGNSRSYQSESATFGPINKKKRNFDRLPKEKTIPIPKEKRGYQYQRLAQHDFERVYTGWSHSYQPWARAVRRSHQNAKPGRTQPPSSGPDGSEPKVGGREASNQPIPASLAGTEPRPLPSC